MARINPRTAPASQRVARLFFLSSFLLFSIYLTGSDAAGSCPNCDIADSLLKPCNSALLMDTWPGTLVYQPTSDQAACACNQNYYDQMVGCLKCQSSTSAHYSVKALPDYQLVCQSYGQAWKQINLPSQSTTTAAPTSVATSTAPGASTTPGSITSPGGNTSSSNSLSSGAIAGIVVSVIALIVALSVAAYVYGRRKRESLRQQGDMDEYKYRDSPDSYMEVALPQYTGMIQPTLPPISKVSNLRVMNPDSDDDEAGALSTQPRRPQQKQPSSFEVNRTSSPGWRRGSFDDD